jgi:hypothetical protein
MVYNVVYLSQYITGHCLIPIIACHMEHNVTIFDIRKLCLMKMMYIVYEVCRKSDLHHSMRIYHMVYLWGKTLKKTHENPIALW